MEEEVIKPVLNEVLQELKELKQEQAETIKVVFEIKDRVKGYEEKLSDLKIISRAVDIHPVMYAINAGLNKIKNAIETQPKSITRQFRFLLFPENNATEYYKIVFGRIFFWTLIFVTVTYLFVLGKHFIDKWICVKQNEMVSNQYKKAWQYLYKQESKIGKKKMDSVLFKNYK